MKKSARKPMIHLEPQLIQALSLKAAETKHTISDLVNEAVKFSLAEDIKDLASFDEREDEPNIAFEDVLKDLKDSGKL